MSDRFSSLKSSINTNEKPQYEKPQYEKPTFKQNIFKQRKPPKPSKYSNKETTEHAHAPNNTFKTPLNQKKVFSMVSENFPQLILDTSNHDNIMCEKNTYLEKIRQTKLETEKKELIRPGWTILHINKTKAKSHTAFLSQYSTKTQIVNYYNPSLSKKIFQNRQEQRLELNEILGDISPYWNMIIYDDEEDEEYNENEYDDIEEYDSSEYYDETW